MRIEAVVIGMFQSASHIVVDEATGECAIIDVGENGRGIREAVDRLGAKPTMILLTHGHLDHVGGLAEVRRAFPEVPIYMHPADLPYVEGIVAQGRMFGFAVEEAPPIDHELKAGQTIQVGSGVRFTVLETPGHTPGGVTFYEPHEQVAFVGDALFQGSVGRTDLPGGDGPLLLRSIRERLLTLADETSCYCGHGPKTTIGDERARNPFLQPGAERRFGIG